MIDSLQMAENLAPMIFLFLLAAHHLPQSLLFNLYFQVCWHFLKDVVINRMARLGYFSEDRLTPDLLPSFDFMFSIIKLTLLKLCPPDLVLIGVRSLKKLKPEVFGFLGFLFFGLCGCSVLAVALPQELIPVKEVLVFFLELNELLKSGEILFCSQFILVGIL